MKSQRKPAREIGICNRSVSGIVPNFGHYESTLERDLMELLRFDKRVERYSPQPVTISYVDEKGVTRSYTPDGLIEYHRDLAEPPILCEVKHQEDFRKSWRSLLRKFRAAKDYANANFWCFRVFTERDIRTPYLENVKFLTRFVDREVEEPVKQWILSTLWDLGEADVDFLLCALYRDKANRATLIAPIWHLVASGVLGCDLDEPLSMNTVLWPMEDESCAEL